MQGLAEHVLVTCEHASNRLPSGFDLGPALLQQHIAWDPGAATIAERLAQVFSAPLCLGEYSRLVVDLNRTVGNRVLMRQVSDGHCIPFNYGLSDVARKDRIERFYLPYRDAVSRAARKIIDRHGWCLHICVHTFSPSLNGNTRGNDIGLLHDPRWGIERAVCKDLRVHLTSRTAYVTWFNRPYSGTADGILPAMRRDSTPEQFVGIELEINQKHAESRTTLLCIADHFATAFQRSAVLARRADRHSTTAC